MPSRSIRDDLRGLRFLRQDAASRYWLYEVKASLEDTGEFELTPKRNACRRQRVETRPAAVPDSLRIRTSFRRTAGSSCSCQIPWAMGSRNRFKQVGHGAVRFRFEHSSVKHTAS